MNENVPDSKASLIPVESFADVSKYVQLFSSAYLSASCLPTSRCSSWSILFPTFIRFTYRSTGFVMKYFPHQRAIKSQILTMKSYFKQVYGTVCTIFVVRIRKRSYPNHNLIFIIDMLFDSFKPMVQIMKC